MFLIGLTGGIAAGKSTVANLWKSLGAFEIDADEIAKEVVSSGSVGIRQVTSEFGRGVLDAAGNLNRKALAEIVFKDQAKREKLESIVHPLVQARAKQLLDVNSSSKFVIYNVPLLVEAKVKLPFDAIVTVEAPENVRVARLMENRSMKRKDAEARIKSQASATERANHADYILNSNQPLELLLRDARDLWKKFEKAADGAN